MTGLINPSNNFPQYLQEMVTDRKHLCGHAYIGNDGPKGGCPVCRREEEARQRAAEAKKKGGRPKKNS